MRQGMIAPEGVKKNPARSGAKGKGMGERRLAKEFRREGTAVAGGVGDCAAGSGVNLLHHRANGAAWLASRFARRFSFCSAARLRRAVVMLFSNSVEFDRITCTPPALRAAWLRMLRGVLFPPPPPAQSRRASHQAAATP